jgi:hypothetical protein
MALKVLQNDNMDDRMRHRRLKNRDLILEHLSYPKNGLL